MSPKMMKINTKRLNYALSMIDSDWDGIYSTSQFDLLFVNLWRAKIKDNSPLNCLDKHIKAINFDFWKIGVIVEKIEWQQKACKRSLLHPVSWGAYTTCDIDLFHVRLRSIFNYIAKIFQMASLAPKQVPGSFRDIRNWLLKNKGNSNRMGIDIANLILSCEWFPNIQQTRDSIIHDGEKASTVFPNPDEIMFDLHAFGENVFQIKDITDYEVIYKESVNFKLYAGLYIGYLIEYLDSVASYIFEHFKIDRIQNFTKSYQPGLNIIKEWIEKVLDIANSDEKQ